MVLKLLNLGCGNARPGEPWLNVDELLKWHAEGTPERAQILACPNYLDFDILSGPLPFDEATFDGIALLHCLEHFDTLDGVRILQNLHHVLKPGGPLVVSVPNASYFRAVDAEDRNENWPRLFGQTDPANPIPTFRQAALFFEQHKMVFTEDALWCYFRQSGFEAAKIGKLGDFGMESETAHQALSLVTGIMNRQLFSIEMIGVK